MFLEAWRHRLRLEPLATSNKKSMENTSSVPYARDRSRKMKHGKGHPGYETNLRCVCSYKSWDSRDHRDIIPKYVCGLSFPQRHHVLRKSLQVEGELSSIHKSSFDICGEVCGQQTRQWTVLLLAIRNNVGKLKKLEEKCSENMIWTVEVFKHPC